MNKLFGSLNKKKENMNMNIDDIDAKTEDTTSGKKSLTKQQKLMVLAGIGVACILVLQMFMISNQREMQDHQKSVQSHIGDQAGAIKNTLSNIIHAEAVEVRKSANEKLAELEKMILNNNTEVVTQLQQLQMKIDEIQKQTKNLDKVSSNLIEQISAKLAKASIRNSNVAASTSSQFVGVMPSLAGKIATNYKIYAANSYGLVLQSTDGTFTIANIGKALPGLGEITSITANEVIAGDYKIINEPQGFKLDQAAAVSAYQ